VNPEEFVALAAPCTAVVAGAVTVVAGISRYRSTAGLRSKIHKDATLMHELPDGEAKRDIERALNHRATRYGDRVINGYRPTLLQLTALYGAAATVVAAAVTAMVAAAERDKFGLGDKPTWFIQTYQYLAVATALIGITALLASAAIAITDWFFRHFHRANEEWREHRSGVRQEREDRSTRMRERRERVTPEQSSPVSDSRSRADSEPVTGRDSPIRADR